jgi:hypothetical protein
MKNEMVKEDDKKDSAVTYLWRTQTSSFCICERQTPVTAFVILSPLQKVEQQANILITIWFFFPNQISNQIKKKSQH